MSRWLALSGAVVVVVFLARSVLAPLVVAATLAYIFGPLFDQVEQRLRMPRIAVIGAFYIVLIALLVLGLWGLEARLFQEAEEFSRAGPDLVDTAFTRLLGTDRFSVFGQEVDVHLLAEWVRLQLADLAGRPAGAFQVAERAIDGILKTLLTLVALFYLLLDGRRFVAYLLRLIPPPGRAQTEELLGRVHQVLGRYLRGQVFLIALMASVTYLVLALGFRLPFALPIALATGVLEILPLFGPITAGAIASLVALVNGGPGAALAVALVYLILRQVEDQLVMPIVVGRAVELHPLVAIFSVLTGGAAAGVLGALLAVPVAAALRVTLDYVFPDQAPRTEAPADAPAPTPAEE